MPIKSVIRKMLRPIRVAAGRFVIPPPSPPAATAEDNGIFYKAAKLIAFDKVPGDYLEFGAYEGISLAAAYHAVARAFGEYSAADAWHNEQDAAERRRLWQRMRFVAFDSFEGFPAPTGVDTGSRQFPQGKFVIPRSRFEENLLRAGVPRERTVVVPGWYADTLTETTIRAHGLRHAAMIHIDCVLYASTRTALEFVTPLLVDGTVVVFDDWYMFRGNPRLGEQLAWREWCAVHPEWIAVEYQKEGPWRNSFVVNRADAAASGRDLQSREEHGAVSGSRVREMG